MYRNSTPIHNNNSYFTQLTRSSIKPAEPDFFSEISINEALKKEYVHLNESDEFTFRTKKVFDKLESLRIYPSQIFVLGFCIWVEKINYECRDIYPNKKMDEMMGNLFEKMIKIPEFVEKAKLIFLGKNISFNSNFYGHYIQPLFNYRKNRYLDGFYDLMKKTEHQVASSLFIRILCLYHILYDQSVYQEFLYYGIYRSKVKNIIEDIIHGECGIKLYGQNEVLVALALTLEIRINFIKILPLQKIIDFEIYPPKQSGRQKNKNNIKVKFLLINHTQLYRAYKKITKDSFEKEKHLQKNENRFFFSEIKENNDSKCKECNESIIKLNEKLLCHQCIMKPYCSMDKKIIASRLQFFRNVCGHKYCLNCIPNLLKNFEKNQKCPDSNCNFLIDQKRLKEFIYSLDEFIDCVTCKEKIKIQKNVSYTSCFYCKADNCIKHKTLLQNCFCLCLDCKNPVKIVTYEYTLFTQNIIECQFCLSLWCKACKFRLSKENSYYCKCKCSTCFEFTSEFDKNIKTKCKSCVFVCQACNIDYGEKGGFAIETCPKCSMSMCRSCKNNCLSTLAKNESQEFEKIDLRSYCRFCVIKQKGL